jgi:hypothetical protein
MFLSGSVACDAATRTGIGPFRQSRLELVSIVHWPVEQVKLLGFALCSADLSEGNRVLWSKHNQKVAMAYA